MIKTSLLLVAILALGGCSCTKDTIAIGDEFYGDLSSEDNRVAATLQLEVFNGNLDSLTYEFYVGYLAGHETPSAKGLANTVRHADQHFFKSSQDAFLIILYYQPEHKVIGDISSTPFVDTVIAVSAGAERLDLAGLAQKLRFPR